MFGTFIDEAESMTTGLHESEDSRGITHFHYIKRVASMITMAGQSALRRGPSYSDRPWRCYYAEDVNSLHDELASKGGGVDEE